MGKDIFDIFDEVFGKIAPKEWTKVKVQAACEQSYKRGMQSGFNMSRDHIRRMLLLAGETEMADKVGKLTLAPKVGS